MSQQTDINNIDKYPINENTLWVVSCLPHSALHNQVLLRGANSVILSWEGVRGQKALALGYEQPGGGRTNPIVNLMTAYSLADFRNLVALPLEKLSSFIPFGDPYSKAKFKKNYYDRKCLAIYHRGEQLVEDFYPSTKYKKEDLAFLGNHEDLAKMLKIAEDTLKDPFKKSLSVQLESLSDHWAAMQYQAARLREKEQAIEDNPTKRPGLRMR